MNAEQPPPEGAADAPETGVESYSLTVAFYASFGFPEQDVTSQKEEGE